MATEIEPKITDLGEFSVGRVLPNRLKKMVGPFVFFDHMGPASFGAGEGVNVRPHPHIGLATLTYLLKGRILHRDSLGNCLEIEPGDVNWMLAGKGITHSERETIETHSIPHELDGLQCWVALPHEYAEVDPDFTHVNRLSLPCHIYEGVTIRLAIGEAYGLKSPIKVYSRMFLVDVLAKDKSVVERPNPEQECLLYLADGEVEVDGKLVTSGSTLLLGSNEDIKVNKFSRLIMLGGESWPEVPHLFWNFVSFSEERIEQAKRDWQDGRFPIVPGDNEERIPLP